MTGKMQCNLLLHMQQKVVQTPTSPSLVAGGLDFGDVDLAHVHHRGEDAFGFSAAGGQRVRQHARRDLPGNSSAVFAPAARAFLAAVADNRLPGAIRFLLRVRRDLEAEGFGVFEHWPAIDTQARNAADGELHRENVSFPAIRVVARSFVNRGDFTVGESSRVKARRILRILVEPKADSVLCFCVAHKIASSER
jgi:hypothetical protein